MSDGLSEDLTDRGPGHLFDLSEEKHFALRRWQAIETFADGTPRLLRTEDSIRIARGRGSRLPRELSGDCRLEW